MDIDEFPGCCQINMVHHFFRYDDCGEVVNYSYDSVYYYIKDKLKDSYPGMFIAATNSSQKEVRKALRDLGFKTIRGFRSTWDSKEKVYFHYYRAR